MAKKPYEHTDKSGRKCAGKPQDKPCRTMLKMNLLAKKPDAKLCYRCFTGLPPAAQETKQEKA